MKAMVLAAGIGSRLRPLTERVPKALVEVGGQAMLEIVARRLIRAGVDEMIVNVHHLPDQVVSFIKARDGFGIRVEVSREDGELLDTGGGLKKAGWFFDDGRPFFVHNVDVLSDIDLRAMYRFHRESPALATLAVQPRESSRRLLFDAEGLLRGWESRAEGRTEWAGEPSPIAEPLAFAGIHVVSPEIFAKMSEDGVFSINRAYLRLAGRGERIQAFRADGRYWQDIGSPAKLEEARRRALEEGPPA